MAGLIAGHAFRHMKPFIIEAAMSPPDNHGALLRFRTPAIHQLTGATLKKVSVRKAIIERDGSLNDRVSLLHANAYSKKVTGKWINRSIIDLSPATRYVAGPNFLTELRQGLNIQYDTKYVPNDIGVPTISTIPMGVFVSHMVENGTWDLKDVPDFDAHRIVVYETELMGVDLHQTVYNPWPEDQVYRASFVGNRLIVECITNMPGVADGEERGKMVALICQQVLGSVPEFTGVKSKIQQRGKIVELEPSVRQSIIGAITDEYGVYSLGRFATWRNILLDDVVEDCEVIANLIRGGRYGRDLHKAKSHEAT